MSNKMACSSRTSWRERHNELITSVRAARRVANESRSLREPNELPLRNERHTCDKQSNEYMSEIVNNICGNKENLVNGPAPLPILVPRVPASMLQADAMRKANIANGGRAAKGRLTTINTQVTFSKGKDERSKELQSSCGFGSSVERFGAVNGICDSIHIVNSNVTSIGMQQAFGKAEENGFIQQDACAKTQKRKCQHIV